MESNICFYCGKKAEWPRRHFCSDTCNQKYWAGVYSKRWKEGDAPVMLNQVPTKEELENEKSKKQARRLAYKQYPKNKLLRCDICGKKTKDIQRHHEDYNSDICILVCRKCHGFIKRYNTLKRMLYTDERRLNKK